MKNFLLLAVVISFSAYGNQENCNTDHAELREITNLAKNLNWEAASSQDFKNAACLRTAPFSDEEMQKWISAHQGPRIIGRSINGIAFENESEENLRAFEHLTSAVNLIGDKEPKRQKYFKSKCKKVECAVKEIFGAQTGLQLLFMQQKYGMNGSHLPKVNADPWKKSELDTILLALSDYPEGVLPIKENKTLMKFKRGYQRAGGDLTLANAVIEVFDLWTVQGPESQRMTLTHELGHVIAQETHLDDSPEWMNLGGWKSQTKIENGKPVRSVTSAKNETMVSVYGKTNNWEDLAESVVAYRYNPSALKSASPQKYAIIKKLIFDNVEYTSNKACTNPTRLSASLKERAIGKIKSWNPSPEDIKQIAKGCSGLALTGLSNGPIDLSYASFQQCYEKSANEQSKDLLKELVVQDPHYKFMGPMLRNVEMPEMPAQKLKEVTSSARKVHADLLRKEIGAAFKKGYFFQPKCDKEMLGSSIIDLNSENIGTPTYAYKDEFQKLAHRTCVEIKGKGSLRRTLGLDFSDEEIQNQVDSLIR